MRDLRLLPKAHLHLHLEGAMRPSTLASLADRYGVEVPPVGSFRSFSAFIDRYRAACDLLRTPEDLARLVREVVEDAALAGAIWVEPSYYAAAHRSRLGSDDETTALVLSAGAAAAAELGIGFGLMLGADRTQPPQDALEVAERAVRLRPQGVVSFGLANDETLGDAAMFAEAFAVARAGGLLSTPHGGELSGPASVRACVESLRASRVQHGVRAIEDPVLLTALATAGVCLDVCPTSNVLLGVVPSLEAHPLPDLLAAGVKCSLNADDPLLFGASLLDEYISARDVMGLSEFELAAIASTSVTASGAPRALVSGALEGIEAWLRS